ncbi:MAG: precorrin-2 C(20)-methyltransferase [Candidatus Metalachnospira sp.]|nr:precorrin-2 C(20)-methyltransferase [Candidatus Metalachnospira sp.]
MTGRLFGVGVGPGDPELMTLKAVRVIEKCNVVAIPANDKDNCTAYNIAKHEVKNIERKDIISVDIPMTKDKNKLAEAYNEGIKNIEDKLLKGKDVAFINLGDPTVYSTYMGIHERIIDDGFDAEIINGVPSFCAVAAKLGISLAKSRESIHIYPATYDSDDIFNTSGTKVLMKSGKRLAEVKKKLIDLEKCGKIKSYAVTDCTMKSEVICDNISELDENGGYFTTVIVKSTE